MKNAVTEKVRTVNIPTESMIEFNTTATSLEFIPLSNSSFTNSNFFVMDRMKSIYCSSSALEEDIVNLRR
ncbi:MAG TPA: hypothetical protein VEH06_03510 [Candidatus Bathyarchaeia archaeon]|nr:hypothetical protein [Candidatus Bathyarchaeia archaeon]